MKHIQLITDDFGNLLLTAEHCELAKKLADVRSNREESDCFYDAAMFGRIGYYEYTNTDLSDELDALRDDDYLFDDIVPDLIRWKCDDLSLVPTIVVYGKVVERYAIANIASKKLAEIIYRVIMDHLPKGNIDPQTIIDQFAPRLRKLSVDVMRNRDRMGEIAEMLSDEEWDSCTASDVAEIVRDAGYQVRDIGDEHVTDDEDRSHGPGRY